MDAIFVLRDEIGDSSGRSMMGNSLKANAVPMPVDVICCMNPVSVQVDRTDDVSAVSASELGL